jgi:sulfate permease, SulP family
MTQPAPVIRRRSQAGDVVAGVTVALVLIPQSLAYAELAGVPAELGLVAAVVAPLAAVWFASSAAIQTGPTAMSAVLVFGVLATQLPPGSPEYAGAAALLAVLVGLLRLTLGLLHGGSLAFVLSQPVLRGFTLGAAVLIVASQLPAALGVRAQGLSLIGRAAQALTAPGLWSLGALLTTIVTLMLILGARRLHPFVPGALVAVVAATAISRATGGGLGPVLGGIDVVWPLPQPMLPWQLLPQLLVGSLVIALVGFAEPVAIARRFADSRRRWDPNRELVSQGMANLAAGLFGAFPVGASFSRSALNHVAGAATRWAGLVTGLTALLLLAFAPLLADLPRAVLAGVVIAAVRELMRLQPVASLWRLGRAQAGIAWTTVALTLLLEPRIDQAVLAGVAVAVLVHLLRETRVGIEHVREGGRHLVKVEGVLWFASATQVEDAVRGLWNRHRDEQPWRLDLTRVAHVDLDAALVLAGLQDQAAGMGLTFDIVGTNARTRQRLRRLGASRAGAARFAGPRPVAPAEALTGLADGAPGEMVGEATARDEVARDGAGARPGDPTTRFGKDAGRPPED